MGIPVVTREVHLVVGDKIKYTAHVAIDREKNTISIAVDKVDGAMIMDLAKGTWIVDFQMKRVTFDVPSYQSALNTACYLGCLVGAGSSIVTCVMRAKNEDELWKCIDDNVGILGGGVIGCIISCA